MCPGSTDEAPETSTGNPLPPASVLSHLVDVHCHPTDSSPIPDDHVAGVQLGQICAMSTHTHDQEKVKELGERMGDRAIMCFGYHPWWAHQISLSDTLLSTEEHYRTLFSPSQNHEDAFQRILPSLPAPRALSSIVDEVRRNLQISPTAMLGEVGIDRAFRVRYPQVGDDGMKLSPFTVPLEHQLAILEAQIGVAVELGRNVSLHSVKASGATVDLLKRMRSQHGTAWEKINVDLHSCTLSADVWKNIEYQKKSHQNVFLSLSTAINVRPNSTMHIQLIQACDPTRLLVESDFPFISDTTQRTWDVLCLIARERGWKVEADWGYPEDDPNERNHKDDWGAVKRIEANWHAFRKGGKGVLPDKESKKERRLNSLQRRFAPSDDSE
ncbi:TatD DNase family protein [Ceratobasidium sp. AG-Ba]|nr:TatD DNase family protein [Ceratobasidium sp. AG-Ba]